MELAKRGIIKGVHNVVCPLCFLEKEDVEHLFGSCPFSNLIWSKFCMWIRVGGVFHTCSLLDRLNGLNSVISCWFFV